MTRGLPVVIQSSLVDILDWVMGVERSWSFGLVNLQLLKDDRVGGVHFHRDFFDPSTQHEEGGR